MLNEAVLTNLNVTSKTVSNLQITIPAIDIPGLNDQEPDEPLGIQAAGEDVYIVFITNTERSDLAIVNNIIEIAFFITGFTFAINAVIFAFTLMPA